MFSFSLGILEAIRHTKPWL